MTDLVNTATWTSKLVADDWVAGADAMVAANERVIDSNTKVNESSTKVPKNLRLTEDGLKNFRASVDPAYRAQLQFAAGTEKLAQFQKSGVGTAEQYTAIQSALARRLNGESVPAIEKFGSAMQSAAGAEASRLAGGIGPLGTALAELGGEFLAVAAVAGAFAIALEQGVEKLGEEEKQLTDIESAIESTNGTLGISVEQMKKMAEEMSGKTLFPTEQVEQAEQTLLHFQHVSGPIFKEAIQVSAELAERMGTDIPTAAQRVGMALESPLQGLQRLSRQGLRLGDDLGELAKKFNDRSPESMAKELKLIHDAVGDPAEAADKGLLGATHHMTEAWNELLKAFGQKTGAYDAAVAGIEGITVALKELSHWHLVALPGGSFVWLPEGDQPAPPPTVADMKGTISTGAHADTADQRRDEAARIQAFNSMTDLIKSIKEQTAINAETNLRTRSVDQAVYDWKQKLGNDIKKLDDTQIKAYRDSLYAKYDVEHGGAPGTLIARQQANLADQQRIDLLAKSNPAAAAYQNTIVSQGVARQQALGTDASAVNRLFSYNLGLADATDKKLASQAASLAAMKETLGQYLAGVEDEARMAGLSATEREDELNIIKAAQVVQKAQGKDASQLVKTYAEVGDTLSDVEKQQIRNEDAAKRINALAVQHSDQIADALVGLKSETNQRELNLAIQQEERNTGAQMLDDAKKRLQLLQDIGNSTAYRDITEQLQKQNELAGMYGDHLEQEQTVQNAILSTHGQISEAQANELRAMVAQNQELSKQAQLMSGIQDQFKTFFNSLMHGDLRIGTLVTGILDQYMSKVSDELSSELMAAVVPQKEIVASGKGVKSADELQLLAQSDSQVGKTTASILLAAQSGMSPLHVTMDNLPSSMPSGMRGSLDTGGDAGGSSSGDLATLPDDMSASMTQGGTNAANDITSAFDTSGTGLVSDLGKVFRDGASLFGNLFSSLLGGGSGSSSSLGTFLGKIVGVVLGTDMSSLFGGGSGGKFTPVDVTPGPMDLINTVPTLKYAGGGSVTGPGGPTDDSVAARLSAGEFVVNADAAQQNAGLLNAINSGARPANDNRGGTTINISIDARGAQQGVGQEIATKLEPMIRAIAAQESARREPQTIMRSVAAAKSSAHVRGAR